MIRGMTGFGSSELSTGNVKALVEMKSVNHRYCDINYYLPGGFSSFESKIKQALNKEIQRGRITVSIKIVQKPEQSILMNEDSIKKYLLNAKKIEKSLKIKNDLTLSNIINLPGVIETKEIFIDPKKLWPNIEKAATSALKDLVVMRKREGRSLSVDVSAKLKVMLAQVKTIKVRSKDILKSKKSIMTKEEFSSFQKSSDVNEEVSRLVHYISEVKKLLTENVSVGKKIDFIAQEMQRETNTIGSKLQDEKVSNAVIDLKSSIEKIREQAQNIE